MDNEINIKNITANNTKNLSKYTVISFIATDMDMISEYNGKEDIKFIDACGDMYGLEYEHKSELSNDIMKKKFMDLIIKMKWMIILN